MFETSPLLIPFTPELTIVMSKFKIYLFLLWVFKSVNQFNLPFMRKVVVGVEKRLLLIGFPISHLPDMAILKKFTKFLFCKNNSMFTTQNFTE